LTTYLWEKRWSVCQRETTDGRRSLLEQTSLIGHLLGLAELKRLLQESVLAHDTRVPGIDHCCKSLDMATTYSLKNTWPTLGVPALDIATELFARIENTIIVILVVQRPSDGVPEHALC
jgi:hypothetical protein